MGTPGPATSWSPSVPAPGPDTSWNQPDTSWNQSVPQQAPQPHRQPSAVGKYLIGAVSALLVVGVLVGAYLLGRSGGDDDAAPTSTSTPSTSTTSTSTTSTTPTTITMPTTTPPVVGSAPPTATTGNVLAEPAGLFCRDLRGRGYSYSAAVAYYDQFGRPDQMDADKNGIPCETVYPRSDIVGYWPQSTYDVVPSYELPSGLLCRDLQARGIGVYDALRYYIWEGSPDRMDADGNGIPCETVYSNAATVWLTEF